MEVTVKMIDGFMCGISSEVKVGNLVLDASGKIGLCRDIDSRPSCLSFPLSILVRGKDGSMLWNEGTKVNRIVGIISESAKFVKEGDIVEVEETQNRRIHPADNFTITRILGVKCKCCNTIIHDNINITYATT